ncbi:hypothetical protein [Gymnodinialimonas ulvae]|uniref:hypothetical protein n=1 Tax=Gymnodinialimonas ulvae TaxID=3126504 RepID=UPI0030A29152
MKYLLLMASVLAVSACVFEPTSTGPAAGNTGGGDPALQDTGACVDQNGNFAACDDAGTGTFFRTSPSDPFCTEEVDSRTGQIVSRICA